LGQTVGHVPVSEYSLLPEVVRDKNIIVGVLAVPASSAQVAADDLVAAGVKIIFNYSEALLETPSDVTVHTSNPAVELLYGQDFTDTELDAYVDANADAVDELAPELLFANHVLLGGAVGSESRVERWAVKAHGSELEYSMRGNERLSRYGAEALEGATAVYVG